MTLMSTVTITKIQDDFYKGVQSIELHRIVEVGEYRYRIIIDRDSHDFQSVAKAEVWTATGWAMVISRPIQMLRAKAFSYGMRDIGPAYDSFDSDAGVLLDAARAVIEP